MIVDEAHATGVIGREGRGLVHELGLSNEVITVGTLGKALGSYGAFVCCDARTADMLVNRARTLIYSTALPPPSIGAALKALELMPSLVPRLHENARTLRGALGVEVSDMPIVPLVFGEPETALAAERGGAASRASSPRRSARPRCPRARPGCGSSPPRRTIRPTSSRRPLLYENVMNELGYSVASKGSSPDG